MEPTRLGLFGWVLGCAALGACDVPEGFDDFDEGDSGLAARRSDDGVPTAASPPAGYRFAANGTHVEQCIGSKCPTMWSDAPLESPNNCGGGVAPKESYIIHQRGVDWAGPDWEAELHGDEYRVGHKTLREVAVQHDQSVIVQCCPNGAGAYFFAIKTCPDPCPAGDTSCQSTYGPTRFGACVASGGTTTSACDLQVVDAGWRDPHAPHDLDAPSGQDKRVVDVFYDMSWTCNHDGVCVLGESCASCPDDCADDCADD